ncbi:hypothetical protein MPSEU_000048000 [Mayamaea pseudoterrestris]|nr:hypothetical protein MPSEU_000048000 [Mayamaea pseudoterrestris]
MRRNDYHDEHDAAEGTPLLLQSISVSKLPLHFHQKHATMKRPSHSCRSAAGLTASLILVVAMLLMVVPFLTQHGNSMSASAVMDIVQPGIYHLEPIETKDTTNQTNNEQPQQKPREANVTVEEEKTPVANASAAADIPNDQADNDGGDEQEQQTKDTTVPKTSLKFPVPLSPLVRPNNLPPTFMNETVDVAEDSGADEHVTVIATPTVTQAPTAAPSKSIAPVPTSNQDESKNIGQEEQDEVTDDEEEETFAELAVRLLPLYYQRMLATLDALTPTVQPGQVYVSRKAILKVRDLLDVFAPIYPNRKMEVHDDVAVAQTQRQQTSFDHAAIHEEQENARYDHRRHHHHHHHNARRHDGESKHPHHHHDHHRVLSSKHKHDKNKHHHHHSDSSKTDSRHADKTDPWWELRRLLDGGYETIGTFLDLDHSRVKYTTKMETKHRDKVLDWLEEFRKYAFTHDVLSMFQPPPSHFGTYEHYKESHLFWGSAKETKRPSPDEPAAAVLRRLLKHQAKAAAKYLDVSLDFRTVMEKKRHEEYHNLRKVLRSMVDEFEIMGDVIDPYGILSEEVSVLKRARSSLGDLNDDYTAFSIYDGGDGHRRRKHGREDSIHDKWLDFKKWAVQKGGLKDTLKSLEEKLDEAK